MPTTINDLPNEVLTLIFSELGPGTPKRTSSSLVCRRWRALAREALFRDVDFNKLSTFYSLASWRESPATALKSTTRSLKVSILHSSVLGVCDANVTALTVH